MKTFKTSAAQGDCLLRKVSKLPVALTPFKAEDGQFIIAHSETGHHHCVKERSDVKLYASVDQFRGCLLYTSPSPRDRG